MLEGLERRSVLSWALYDWANSAFATTVMAGFFPLFLNQYWVGAGESSTWILGWANSIASIVVAALAPLLGAIADRATSKKRFLLLFAMLGVVMSGGLSLVGRGQWPVAAALYVIAAIGFSGGNVFYDALIVSVAPARKIDVVSALGYAAGYLGGGLLFAVNVVMTIRPHWFGLADATAAVRWSFVTVAVWWGVFSVPVMLFVHEPQGAAAGGARAMLRGGLLQVKETLAEVRQLRVVVLFLAAYWLYIDGVDTVVRMAVDYGLNIGFPAEQLVLALLLTQFVGFPAAIAFGAIGERIGTKRGIFLGIAAYVVIIAWGARMASAWEFYALAVGIGLVQGGVQSLSRAFYARIIPERKAAEMFGFYNMLGKFAAVLGPPLMAVVRIWTGSPRLALLSVLILFALGGVLLYFVDEEEGQRAAAAMNARPLV